MVYVITFGFLWSEKKEKGQKNWLSQVKIWALDLEQITYIHNMFCPGKFPQKMITYFCLVDGKKNSPDKEQPVHIT